jgi:hypothetical protein
MERSQPSEWTGILGNYANLSDLAHGCAEFYCSRAERHASETYETRQRLSDWIRKFHHECGTLTSQVEEALQRFRKKDCLLLMTAHQPNLFAYGGVLRKATLSLVLAQRLSRSWRVPAVNYFGFADQDFTDDRWVRSALLPDIERRNGALELRAMLPEKVMLNKIPRPPREVLDKWEQDINDWIRHKTKAVAALAKDFGLGVLTASEYSESLKHFWGHITEAYDRARTYADFNAFVISQVINNACGYDTLFCRFSECQRIFKKEFCLLIQDFRKYSQCLQGAIATSESEERGVYNNECCTIPVWYHCCCGSKARLAAREIEPHVTGRGTCLRCGKEYEVDFSQDSEIWTDLERVSARALTMPLVFFNGLEVTCYVGGVGGMQYLCQARHVADCMGMAFPPIAIWRPRDRYLGLAQLEAFLTLKHISGTRDLRKRLAEIQREIEELESYKKKITDSELDHAHRIEKIRAVAEQQNRLRHGANLALISRQLGLIENAKQAMNLYPCMIDYAINIGLRETLEQWEAFLKTTGDLRSDITLRTKTDKLLSPLGLELSRSSFGGSQR